MEHGTVAPKHSGPVSYTHLALQLRQLRRVVECPDAVILRVGGADRGSVVVRQDVYKRQGMTRQGLEGLGTENIDLAILENVGNLVCPAELDTGAVKNVMILSVPEGHDKPLKYPLMFEVCQALIINKIDVLPYFDFDMDKVREFALKRNPELKIFPISAKTGEGVDAWCQWLENEVNAWNA